MADSRKEKQESDRATQPSSSAFVRLWKLRAEAIRVAEAILAGNCYSDFFVEGSGPPWHEAFEDIVAGKKIPTTPFTLERMTYLDSVRQEDYGDFFVEGAPPPWHEAFDDFVEAGGANLLGKSRMRDNPYNVLRRARGLQKCSVLQAYQRLRERARSR